MNITLKLLPAFTKIYERPETVILLHKKANVLPLPFCGKEELDVGFLQTLFVFKTELQTKSFYFIVSFLQHFSCTETYLTV